jgi:sulfide:quinone oxidoreductase
MHSRILVLGAGFAGLEPAARFPGVFSERAASVVAAALLTQSEGGDQPEPFDGRGSCYVELGGGRVGRVDVDFLSGPKPTGTFQEPSLALVAEKTHFGASRQARWFGR